MTNGTALVYGQTGDYPATLYGGALEGEYGNISVSNPAVLSVTPKNTGETPNLAVAAKKVGTSIVTLTREENRFYAPHTASYTFTVTPRVLIPILTATDKLFDGLVSAKGTLRLENIVAGDNVTCQYADCTFASPLVGTRRATATGITCVDLDLTVTTGQPFVYGDNTTSYDEETSVVTYAATDNLWQVENKAQKIATNAPATASLNVYLRKGEHLLVDTAIGTYNGRMDVTVKKHGEQSVLAIDKIDTFFPVDFGDDFRVSKLGEATRSQELTSRGDYWNGIEPFTAPETGVYTFTFTVTGKFYLHDVDERYTQNMPGMKPVIELRKFTINGTEMHGIDKQ